MATVVESGSVGELGGANLYSFSLNEPVAYYDTDGRFVSIALAAVIAKIGWEGACWAYALNETSKVTFPKDGHEHKKHCMVGCLRQKCMLDTDATTMLGQIIKEIVWAIKDGRVDVNESIKDTLATAVGIVLGQKGVFGDCQKDCDCKILDS